MPGGLPALLLFFLAEKAGGLYVKRNGGQNLCAAEKIRVLFCTHRRGRTVYKFR